MGQDFISYNLSYFRPNQESSLDVVLNTQGQTVNGFQVVFQITATPPIDLVDQNPDLNEIQLDIIGNPQISFLTNRVRTTGNGYQVELAAITTDPGQPLAFNQDTAVAKLIFKQSASGNITVSQDNKFTKIATTSTSASSSIVPPALPTTISTQPTGQTYPSTQISAPVIVSIISIALGLVALVYTLRQLKNA